MNTTTYAEMPTTRYPQSVENCIDSGSATVIQQRVNGDGETVYYVTLAREVYVIRLISLPSLTLSVDGKPTDDTVAHVRYLLYEKDGTPILQHEVSVMSDDTCEGWEYIGFGPNQASHPGYHTSNLTAYEARVLGDALTYAAQKAV